MFAALETKRAEAGRLLAIMNEPGFWDRSVDCVETLEKYRAIDIAIQVEERADLAH